LLLGSWVGFQGGAGLIAETATGETAKFRVEPIAEDIGIGYGIAVVDMDADRRLDVVLVDKQVIAWYRNPDWERFVVVEGLTEHDHVCVAARDIDGDGKAELAAGAGWNPGDTIASGSLHYLIPGRDRRARWGRQRLPHEPTVHRMRWLAGPDGPLLIVAPLHGRANQKGAGEGVKLLAYRPPTEAAAGAGTPLGASGTDWSAELIDSNLHMTHNVDPVQWDDDPEEELLVIGREGWFVFDRRADGWWGRQLGRNPGHPEHRGGSEVRLGRCRGGSRFVATVEPFHGSTLAVYTPSSESSSALWTRRVVDGSLNAAHAVACGDVDGRDGDEIVVGWRSPDADGKVGLRLYTAEDSRGERWRRTTVDDNTMACEDLRLADLDGDGRLDIVAAGRATHNLVIYWNESTTP